MPTHRHHRPFLPTLLSTVTLAAAAAGAAAAFAQVTTARVEGLRDHSPRLHALTGLRLVTAPGKVVDNGTVVLRDGVIVAAGSNVAVPAGARVWKMDGKTAYAGFIDMASPLGVPAALKNPPPAAPNMPRPAPVRPGGRALASENPMVRPEQDVASQLEWRADDMKAARELGFTSVLASPAAGVFRGQGALINTGDATDARGLVLAPRVAQHMAHERNGNGYPNSMMGAIALVRQTLLDARWYRGAQAANAAARERVEPNASLDALQPVLAGRQPVIYATEDEQDFLRIARVRDEFGLRAIALGNGYEYRRAAQLKSLKLPVIVPLLYPAVPEVENPDTALDASLENLQHWEQAPSNLAYLDKAGVEFAVTTAELKDAKRDFWSRLRLAIKRGLPAERALAALTTTPARLLGEEKRLGSIEPGRLANLVIASGDLFTDERAVIEATFVDGKPYTTDAWQRFDARGAWSVTAGGKSGVWNIAGTLAKPVLLQDGGNVELQQREHQLVARTADGTVVAEGHGDTLKGTLTDAAGRSVAWTASRSKPFSEAPPKARTETPPPPLPATYPYGPFGIATPARPAVLLVKNATVWTNAKDGKLEQADLLVRDGRIAAVGKNLAVPAGAQVIDASGKHVTPGIIDAHSHTGVTKGINEATSSVTAEVRIGDVIDATNIGIYRSLAGGVTASNVLHGSANTIGGQNQVIKMRWGADADGLKLDGAIPGIKFALGENVKQANWGAEMTRYPQSRMGVEQILRDAFLAARAYQAEHAAWKKNPAGRAEPRRDLQLDTLVEILEGKRVVHIHSYRQDEILMFARFAKEFGIPVATFQHVLEGYKVADEIAAIGAGGSTFADWWGYKFEVVDGIPYNGVLMHAAGVLTSFNSDSDELARHLNIEAGKAMKYGGLAETEALKFVTLNPARQLRIDGRTGSLEAGKDADFVIWSGHPLASTSRAEQTWIEGRRYFDLETDARLRQEAADERARLLAKALPARLAQLGGRPADAAPAEKPAAPKLADMQAWRELQEALHHAIHHRGSYWSGREGHECTEEK